MAAATQALFCRSSSLCLAINFVVVGWRWDGSWVCALEWSDCIGWLEQASSGTVDSCCVVYNVGWLSVCGFGESGQYSGRFKLPSLVALDQCQHLMTFQEVILIIYEHHSPLMTIYQLFPLFVVLLSLTT